VAEQALRVEIWLDLDEHLVAGDQLDIVDELAEIQTAIAAMKAETLGRDDRHVEEVDRAALIIEQDQRREAGAWPITSVPAAFSTAVSAENSVTVGVAVPAMSKSRASGRTPPTATGPSMPRVTHAKSVGLHSVVTSA